MTALVTGDDMSSAQVEEWFARAKLCAATAQERVNAIPNDPDAREALQRALAELSAAMVVRGRRRG